MQVRAGSQVKKFCMLWNKCRMLNLQVMNVTRKVKENCSRKWRRPNVPEVTFSHTCAPTSWARRRGRWRWCRPCCACGRTRSWARPWTRRRRPTPRARGSPAGPSAQTPPRQPHTSRLPFPVSPVPYITIIVTQRSCGNIPIPDSTLWYTGIYFSRLNSTLPHTYWCDRNAQCAPFKNINSSLSK